MLPRIIMEDTRFTDINTQFKKNIVFKRLDLATEWKGDDASQTAAFTKLREENSEQRQQINILQTQNIEL